LEKLGLIQPPSPLEKAILCSYYRCIEGCSSPNTNEYCYDLYENSWTDICENPKKLGFSSNGKICGWNAIQWPVEIKLKDSKLSKSAVSDAAQCIVFDKSSGGINWWEVTQRFIPILNIIKQIGDTWGEVKILFIDNRLISSKETETCSFGYYVDINNAIKQTSLDGEAYISTIDNSICYLFGLVGCKPVYFTEVMSRPDYIVIELDKSISKIFEINLPYRINLKSNGKSYDYMLKIPDIGYVTYNGQDIKYIRINVTNKTFSEKRVLTSRDEYCLDTISGSFRTIFEKVESGKPRLSLNHISESCSKEEVNFPEDKDAWTEEESGKGWSGRISFDESDKMVGTRSLHATISRELPIRFSFLSTGYPLNIYNYDKLNFWFKSEKDGKLIIYFDKKYPEVGQQFIHYLKCEVEYKSEWGWKKYIIDRSSCTWIRTESPLSLLEFNFDTGSYGDVGINIDGLHFCKNCQEEPSEPPSLEE